MTNTPLPVSTTGMSLRQVISMLQAAEAQGATHVQLACKTADRDGIVSQIDWISMEPVDGTVYVGALTGQGQWDTAGQEALQSLDWA